MKLGMTFGAALVASVSWASIASAQTELSMWYHGAGNEAESGALQMIIDDFNASQADYKVVVESFPQESYNDSVVAAALAGNLPDILDVDGPVMPNWAWQATFSRSTSTNLRLKASLMVQRAIGMASFTLSVSGMLLLL